MRDCSGCTLCCLLGFPGKPHGVLCENAKPGVGCCVYSNKPTFCQEFDCFWNTGVTEVRPDDLGLFMVATETHELHVFHLLGGPPIGIVAEEIQRAADHMLREFGLEKLTVHMVSLRRRGNKRAEVFEYKK